MSARLSARVQREAIGELPRLVGLSAAQLAILDRMAKGERLEAERKFPKWRYWLGPDLVSERDVAECARRGLVTHPPLGTMPPDATTIRYALAPAVRDALGPQAGRT